nr:homer protein [Tanacetum cinerariifolium]
ALVEEVQRSIEIVIRDESSMIAETKSEGMSKLKAVETKSQGMSRNEKRLKSLNSAAISVPSLTHWLTPWYDVRRGTTYGVGSIVDNRVDELLKKDENRVLLDGLDKAAQRVEIAKLELAKIEQQEIENKRIKEYVNQLEIRAAE